MLSSRNLLYLPLSLLSVMAIIHNAFMAKVSANLQTPHEFFDWMLAILFAVGIESGLWVLIAHEKKRAVKAYALVLFILNLLYYGRGGKLNEIINLLHPQLWLYIEGVFTSLIFDGLLSGFAWYLTEVAIENIRKDRTRENEVNRENLERNIRSKSRVQELENHNSINQLPLKVRTGLESVSVPVLEGISGPVLEQQTVSKPEQIDTVSINQTVPETVSELQVKSAFVATSTGELLESDQTSNRDTEQVLATSIEKEVTNVNSSTLDEEVWKTASKENDKQNNIKTSIAAPASLVVENESIPMQRAGEEKRYCLTCKKSLKHKRPHAKYCNDACKRNFSRKLVSKGVKPVSSELAST